MRMLFSSCNAPLIWWLKIKVCQRETEQQCKILCLSPTFELSTELRRWKVWDWICWTEILSISQSLSSQSPTLLNSTELCPQMEDDWEYHSIWEVHFSLFRLGEITIFSELRTTVSCPTRDVTVDQESGSYCWNVTWICCLLSASPHHVAGILFMLISSAIRVSKKRMFCWMENYKYVLIMF